MRHNHILTNPSRGILLLLAFPLFLCFILLFFRDSESPVLTSSSTQGKTTNQSLEMANIAVSSNILVTLAMSSVPDEAKIVEYSVERKRFETIPTWELGYSATGMFSVPLEKIIEIARDDVVSRYGAQPEKMFLNNVEFRRIEFQSESKWFYSVRFMVNTSSKPFLVNPRDNKMMTSIVLSDGSTVAPAYTELSESFEIHLPSSYGEPTPPPIIF